MFESGVLEVSHCWLSRNSCQVGDIGNCDADAAVIAEQVGDIGFATCLADAILSWEQTGQEIPMPSLHPTQERHELTPLG